MCDLISNVITCCV